MICQNCGKREATTHIKRVVNGETSESHLCAECAASDHDEVAVRLLIHLCRRRTVGDVAVAYDRYGDCLLDLPYYVYIDGRRVHLRPCASVYRYRRRPRVLKVLRRVHELYLRKAESQHDESDDERRARRERGEVAYEPDVVTHRRPPFSRGTKAPQAAGKIHSDFEKGFIRAEIVDYDVLVELGSFNAAKEKGKVRSEGKDYVIKDGDVVLFRFNV